VLDRAARLTPGGLRAAIARAVMEVAPDKARERRQATAKDARVERWLEDSGNAALMGCELPPDEVLAADQRITAWARELKKAGLDGGMDQLRARALSGGLRYRPVTSRTLASRAGSVENLKLSARQAATDKSSTSHHRQIVSESPAAHAHH
jgi:hypothetical protein